MAEHVANLKPGESLTVTLDQGSLGDVHGKADAGLAGLRAQQTQLEGHDQTLNKHAGLIRELGREKAEVAKLEFFIARLAELEGALTIRATKDDLRVLDEKLSERIRLAANLGDLLPAK